MTLMTTTTGHHAVANMLVHAYERADAETKPKAREIAWAEFMGMCKALDRLGLAQTDQAVRMAVKDELDASPPNPGYNAMRNEAQKAWYYDRAIGVMTRLGLTDYPENPTKTLYAYPGDCSDGFPFRANAWYWQTGNVWMAVAEWESILDWMEDVPKDQWPDLTHFPVTTCPPSGTAIYRDHTGIEHQVPVDYLRATFIEYSAKKG